MEKAMLREVVKPNLVYADKNYELCKYRDTLG